MLSEKLECYEEYICCDLLSFTFKYKNCHYEIIN